MQDDRPAGADEVERVLGLGRPRHRARTLWWGLALVLALGLAAALLLGGEDTRATRYITQPAQRGDLTVTVTATGTLQPVNQVDVGSELSGRIDSVEVDYNDRVSRGQVLARLDTERLQAQRIQAQAQLQAARAQRQQAEATRQEAQLKYRRCQRLAERKLCSEDELDASRASLTRAEAGVASAEAQIAVARAALDERQTDLEKAVIRAPIDGVVLQREVEPGQTVAASLQTPVLFVLAESLAQLELQVAVDEADVGLVAEGQEAGFTVDAYPQRRFSGEITQVRFAPETVEGVVTYQTLLAVDNSELLLRPGMTATAEITVQQLHDALLVPNAALRFRPPETAAPAGRRGGTLLSRLFPRPPSHGRSNGRGNGQGGEAAAAGPRGWVLRQGPPTPGAGQTGASDGRLTEITGGGLEAGTPLILDLVTASR